ncbi:glycosyltransferase family 2 protein [Campylobacter cuniculorum]|uniref:Glycosyltransferase, family 2 n=2 Tax=Campylobacter cuniculorum TaxID=374106 RepID=A0A1W6BVA4_9BACT|nr:glycosyltransferase family 2 protein [Campylobacter cuniculorum]ARJ56004.1 glycosyltransferase, family 2 [Campylobacter cuniculorum DSM 23162 = LMG 24588]QOR05225.1 glycosyltransferase family 2 protein [Campylobacter cuniculorum]
MIIIFPMAGLSSRFAKAGYHKPKYMLDLNGTSVFSKAVLSFKKYFNHFKILFIYRNIENSKEFIKRECEKMQLEFYECVELEKETKGQAHTVMLGLQKAKIKADESLLIFNIDTFRPNFSLPPNLDIFDGYLEVFEGEGEQWSFVLADKNGRVLRTTEKERISNLCSSGIYYFKKAKDFKEVFLELQSKDERIKDEFYIAPMYNVLIKKGAFIGFVKINLDEIIFCGTPLEYEHLIQ